MQLLVTVAFMTGMKLWCLRGSRWWGVSAQFALVLRGCALVVFLLGVIPACNSDKSPGTSLDPHMGGSTGGDLASFLSCPTARLSEDVLTLDDFESGLAVVSSRGGTWVSFDDASKGEFSWEALVPDGESNSVVHIQSDGFEVWSGFGMEVAGPLEARGRCAVDVSEYAGIRFRARGRGHLRLGVATVGTVPVDDGGRCKDGEDCYDEPGGYVRLTEEYQNFEIPFCGMKIEGWRNGDPDWDLREFVGVNFAIQTDMQTEPFEMWFDDLELYSESSARGDLSCDGNCPLQISGTPEAIVPEKSDLALSDQFTLATFEQETTSCGPVTRRYLTYVPASLDKKSSAPIVLALHGYGANAESMRTLQTHGRLDALADRDGFIVVYGNAAPGLATSAVPANSGAWRQSYSDDHEVDDVAYLERVLEDLEQREITSGTNEVFLMGHSNGGGMTLVAAEKLASRLSGIAVFMPYFGDVLPVIPDLSKSPLRRALFVFALGDPGLPTGYDDILEPVPQLWAEALGASSQQIKNPTVIALDDLVDEGSDYSGSSEAALSTRNSSVTQADYSGTSHPAQVRVFSIENGGHFLPNAEQDTESWILDRWGLRNQDFDAVEEAWEYFRAQE